MENTISLARNSIITTVSEKENKKDTINFGVHMMLDGYNGDEKLLNSMELVYKALHDLPYKIKMRPLMPPYVVHAPPMSKKDSGGFSGFVMIAESHISIHTFPKRKFVSIDVYTCKNKIAIVTVADYFKKIFKLRDVEIQVARRGLKFPKHDLVK